MVRIFYYLIYKFSNTPKKRIVISSPTFNQNYYVAILKDESNPIGKGETVLEAVKSLLCEIYKKDDNDIQLSFKFLGPDRFNSFSDYQNALNRLINSVFDKYKYYYFW